MRLPPLTREQLPENQRRFFDAVRAIRRRPISGPFIVTLNSSPDLASRFAHLGHYFHSRGQADESILSARVRTFVALVGSRALDVPYEWNAWVGWALEAGVPQDTVDAIREGREPPNLTPEEALVRDYCTQLVSGNHQLTDATYHAALKHFGVQGLVELAVCLGYFAMIAFPLNAFEIEMTAEQKAIRKPFAPLIVPPHPGTPAARRDMPRFETLQPASTREAIAAITRHNDLNGPNQHYLDRVIRTRGHVSGVFQILLHTPDVADRIATTGEFFLYETVLPPAIRTLVWLITARELDCGYTWQESVTQAKTAGVPDTLIEAIASGGPLTSASEAQLAAASVCLELLRGNHHVCDTTYNTAIKYFGVAATVQIAASLGYIAMMSCVANTFSLAPQMDVSLPAL